MKQNLYTDLVFTESDDAEPVTLDEVKRFIKIPGDITTDDALLTQIIKSARQMIERYCEVSLHAKTVSMRAQIQLAEFKLPFPPIGDVTGLTDLDGTAIDVGNYTVRGTGAKSIVYSPCEDVFIEYETLSGATDEWKTYIMQQTAWLYENRYDDNAARIAPALAQNLKAKKVKWH